MRFNKANLVQLEGLSVEESYWEDFQQFNKLYPTLNLGDKVSFQGKRMIEAILSPSIQQWSISRLKDSIKKKEQLNWNLLNQPNQ